jgi:regulator of replication initiation timing
MMKNEIKKILIDYGVEGEEYSDLEEYLSELLAEIKRLREENTYLNHMLDGVDKHTLDHVAEQAQIKMHEAGECYDFCIVCETEGDEQ